MTTLALGLSLSRQKRPIPFPSALFADTALGGFYDPSDLSSMFQESAGTTAAAVDSPVGRINDKSGRGNHLTQSTAGSRPTLRQSGSLFYLEFDGTDDFLSFSYAQSAYAATIMVAARVTTAGGRGIASIAAGDTSYKALIDDGTLTGILARDRNATIIDASAVIVSASDNVLLGEFDTGQVRARANAGTSGTTVNTNAFGTAANIFMGKLRPAGNFLAGRIYGLAIINRLLTSTEETDLRTYLGAKAGL